MRRLAAACVLLLCLTSCAALLEREYSQSAAHVEDSSALGGTAYRVETYSALRAALRSYVEEGLTQGSVRCPTTYPGNLSVDLEKARRQLMEEDPLGNYALSDVTFRTSRIIAYYDVELEFTYKADAKEVARSPRLASREAVASALALDLEALDTRVCLYLTHYPEGDERYFADALRQAQGLSPAALGRPQVTAELYPQTGAERVAVLTLDYGEDTAALAQRQEELDAALDELWAGPGEPDAQALFDVLRGACTLSDQGGDTAYDAAVAGSANGEGLTLGYAALCRRWRLDCRAVWTSQGCYAALSTDEGERYVDLTQSQFALLDALPGAAEAA